MLTSTVDLRQQLLVLDDYLTRCRDHVRRIEDEKSKLIQQLAEAERIDARRRFCSL